MSDGKAIGIGHAEDGDGAAASIPPAGPGAASVRPAGPTWKGWAVSIIAAVVLSAAATLLLGGWSSFGPLLNAGGPASPASAAGCGGPCCPPEAPGR